MINVVKIGGNVINDPEALGSFLRDFASLKGRKALVHGGGKEATRLSAALGIETTMIEGRRVTDAATVDVVTMVYAGLVNKRIVSRLQALGCDALGLSGADGNVIPATRRSPVPVDFGFVGDIDSARVDDSLIASLIERGIVPVFCAICHDGDGNLLNCNADSVAAAVAEACARIAPTRLTYCFEKPGVMRDIEDESSVIPSIDEKSFLTLKEGGIIADGMVPKLTNALKSARAGVAEVRICRASDLAGEGGTVITI
ncbi:MAG: acetylglutamate kinase [Muribaculaceae bacterium]|nr:acetylglutamate kinase [Muribaculaceae bacterium]